jgi:hypothetical protein
VAPLVLPAGSAGARVVAADAGEIVAYARTCRGLDVRPPVDGRGLVLQPLRPARAEPGRDRPVLSAGRGLVTRRGAGLLGVRATAAPAVPPARLALGAADAAIALRRRGAALSALAVVGSGRGAASGA